MCDALVDSFFHSLDQFAVGQAEGKERSEELPKKKKTTTKHKSTILSKRPQLKLNRLLLPNKKN